MVIPGSTGFNHRTLKTCLILDAFRNSAVIIIIIIIIIIIFSMDISIYFSHRIMIGVIVLIEFALLSKVGGLERGPLILVRTTDELLE
jgi:hypothetical protein